MTHSNTRPREAGFSLIELLIVVAIILIIAAIAIPNYMRSKIAANEAAAAQTVRQISTAEVSYQTTYPNVGYAPDLASLGGPAANCIPSSATGCILDSVVSSGNKSGYHFFAAGFQGAGTTLNTSFVGSAAPLTYNSTGVRVFCVATDNGVLRAQAGSAGATPAPDIPTCLTYPEL